MSNKKLTLEITKREGGCPQIPSTPSIGRGYAKNIALATWVQRNTELLNIKEIKINKGP